MTELCEVYVRVMQSSVTESESIAQIASIEGAIYQLTKEKQQFDRASLATQKEKSAIEAKLLKVEISLMNKLQVLQIPVWVSSLQCPPEPQEEYVWPDTIPMDAFYVHTNGFNKTVALTNHAEWKQPREAHESEFARTKRLRDLYCMATHLILQCRAVWTRL